MKDLHMNKIARTSLVEDVSESTHIRALTYLSSKEILQCVSVSKRWANNVINVLRCRGISLQILSLVHNDEVLSSLGPLLSLSLSLKSPKLLQIQKLSTGFEPLAVEGVIPAVSSRYSAPVPSLILASVESTVQLHKALEIRSVPKKRLLEISAQNLLSYNSIIECGKIDPISGKRLLTEHNKFFGKEVEVYVALSDPKKRILYRASAIADKFNYATNKVGMYLSRQRIQESQSFSRVSSMGIYQATGFKGKPPGRTGLKCGGYFLTMSACIQFESHFCYGGKTLGMQHELDQMSLVNSSIMETSGESDSDKDKNLSRSPPNSDDDPDRAWNGTDKPKAMDCSENNANRKRRSPEIAAVALNLPKGKYDDKRRRIRVISNNMNSNADSSSEDGGDENSCGSASEDNESSLQVVSNSSLRRSDSIPHKSAFKQPIVVRRGSSNTEHSPVTPLSNLSGSFPFQAPGALIGNTISNPHQTQHFALPIHAPLNTPYHYPSMQSFPQVNSNVSISNGHPLHSQWNSNAPPVSPLLPSTLNFARAISMVPSSPPVPTSPFTPTNNFSRLSIKQPIPRDTSGRSCSLVDSSAMLEASFTSAVLQSAKPQLAQSPLGQVSAQFNSPLIQNGSICNRVNLVIPSPLSNNAPPTSSSNNSQYSNLNALETVARIQNPTSLNSLANLTVGQLTFGQLQSLNALVTAATSVLA